MTAEIFIYLGSRQQSPLITTNPITARVLCQIEKISPTFEPKIIKN